MMHFDFAPIIARVLVEHPPQMMGTIGYLHWAHATWPGCTDEQVLRALEIADELHALDCMTREA